MQEIDDTRRRIVLKTIGTGLAGGIALSGSAAAAGGGLQRELAEVRSATARYNDPENAYADGYVVTTAGDPPQIIPLEDVVEEGHSVCGMGFHFGNFDLFGTVDRTQPQVLAYGVDDDGNLILGAVEYIVPKAGPYANDPPDLFEHDDGAEHWDEDSPAPGLWSLHVWVHTHNPAGVFHHTNPRKQFSPEGCEEIPENGDH